MTQDAKQPEAKTGIQSKTGTAPAKGVKTEKESKPKGLSLKQKKAKAKDFLKGLFDRDAKPTFKAEFIGIEYNERGGFYSAIINVSATTPAENGVSLTIDRDMKLPISLSDDVTVEG